MAMKNYKIYNDDVWAIDIPAVKSFLWAACYQDNIARRSKSTSTGSFLTKTSWVDVPWDNVRSVAKTDYERELEAFKLLMGPRAFNLLVDNWKKRRKAQLVMANRFDISNAENLAHADAMTTAIETLKSVRDNATTCVAVLGSAAGGPIALQVAISVASAEGFYVYSETGSVQKGVLKTAGGLLTLGVSKIPIAKELGPRFGKKLAVLVGGVIETGAEVGAARMEGKSIQEAMLTGLTKVAIGKGVGNLEGNVDASSTKRMWQKALAGKEFQQSIAQQDHALKSLLGAGGKVLEKQSGNLIESAVGGGTPTAVARQAQALRGGGGPQAEQWVRQNLMRFVRKG